MPVISLLQSACPTVSKQMKQMPKRPWLHPARCQPSREHQGIGRCHGACCRSDRNGCLRFNKGNIKARSRMIAQYAWQVPIAEPSLGRTMRLKISLDSLLSLEMAELISFHFTASTSAKASSCFRRWELIQPCMRRYRLPIWKRKSLASLMK